MHELPHLRPIKMPQEDLGPQTIDHSINRLRHTCPPQDPGQMDYTVNILSYPFQSLRDGEISRKALDPEIP
jgi:hypothetical protein